MNHIQPPVQDRHEAHFNYRHLSPEELEAYANQGFLLLDDVLTEKGVAEMRDQCMSYWSAKKEGYDPEGSWLKNMLLDDAHHHAPIVRDYYFEGPLVNIAEQLIGAECQGCDGTAYFQIAREHETCPLASGQRLWRVGTLQRHYLPDRSGQE